MISEYFKAKQNRNNNLKSGRIYFTKYKKQVI